MRCRAFAEEAKARKARTPTRVELRSDIKPRAPKRSARELAKRVLSVVLSEPAGASLTAPPDMVLAAPPVIVLAAPPVIAPDMLGDALLSTLQPVS